MILYLSKSDKENGCFDCICLEIWNQKTSCWTQTCTSKLPTLVQQKSLVELKWTKKVIALKNVYVFLLTLEIMLVVSGFGEK